ncbi:MAG: DUF349 domain-containing protein [Bacteroidales bacterium]
METKDLSNQTPEKEESTATSVSVTPETPELSEPEAVESAGDKELSATTPETETGHISEEPLMTEAQTLVDETSSVVEQSEPIIEAEAEKTEDLPDVKETPLMEKEPFETLIPEKESETEVQTPAELEETKTEKVEVSAEIDKDDIADKPAESPEKQDAAAALPDEAKKISEKEEDSDDDLDDSDEEDEEEEISEEQYRNLSRAELVEQLEALVQEPDILSIKSKLALIKVIYLQKEKEELQAKYDSFLEEGGMPEDYAPEQDELSERFYNANSIYREKRQRYNEELEKQKLVNLEEKKKILEELKALISSEETLKKTYDEFKALQEQWKQIGMVPKNEINQLWQNYHFLVEKFFDKVKINKELKDLDLKKNLERKIEICEKAEELLLETSIIKSFKQLQQYHEEWKEVGPVPQDKKDEIWERFKTASDQINERRREYYSEKQNELENNLLAKTALCEKAEKLISNNPATLRQWQKRTNEINELMNIWKTIGPAPKKQNNEIWNRFKTSLDTHFTSYKEYLEKLKEQQLNNYNLKLDLCAQAEALKNSSDWRKTTQELIQLQQEWKTIGAVPRKHSEKIWKRFRSACDEFFQRKTDFFSNISHVEEENKKKKEDIIKRLEEFTFTSNRAENLEALKNFQREWLEVGHVPIKEKDKLQNKFRTVINKCFDKLKIDASEITALNYKNRIESIKDMPDAGRMLYRERNALQLKITKLQEDIKLWENNIGFLAVSKNANIVKEEFQKKIDQAKQELALMEAKLRYLKEM